MSTNTKPILPSFEELRDVMDPTELLLLMVLLPSNIRDEIIIDDQHEMTTSFDSDFQ